MNALRLLFGTLTILPVRPPSHVDRRVAGWAMALAPLAGLVLAVPVYVVLDQVDDALAPVLAVALLAFLTRAIHLDGLADTADGLGSGRRGEGALAIMRKSDIGPFGVATLVLVLLGQVVAISGLAPLEVAAAVVVSRASLPLVCTHWFPAARPDGLGATVAASVAPWQALLAVLAALGATAAAESPYLLGGVVAGPALAWWCVRRFGGVSGDVYGAVVEVTFTGALVLAAVAS